MINVVVKPKLDIIEECENSWIQSSLLFKTLFYVTDTFCTLSLMFVYKVIWYKYSKFSLGKCDYFIFLSKTRQVNSLIWKKKHPAELANSKFIQLFMLNEKKFQIFFSTHLFEKPVIWCIESVMFHLMWRKSYASLFQHNLHQLKASHFVTTRAFDVSIVLKDFFFGGYLLAAFFLMKTVTDQIFNKLIH